MLQLLRHSAVQSLSRTLRHHDHHPSPAVSLLDRLVRLGDLVEAELPHRQVLHFPGALQSLEVRHRPHIGLRRQLVHVYELDVNKGVKSAFSSLLAPLLSSEAAA